MNKPWSNLASVVYKRTYARRINTGSPDERLERWDETVERVIDGNVRGHNVDQHEIERLRYYLGERKAGPGGRGWWFSGTEGHRRLGGVALCNCWFLQADDWQNFVLAQDLLMLGGGVGMSVEHRFVSKLPRVRKNVFIRHLNRNDADFIVPDSREGWNELLYRVLESFFVTGKSFSYSTICVRPAGTPINGFGGVASGPGPLIEFVNKLCAVFVTREGRHVRPIDAADVICAIGEMVVSGNVRRSAIITIGDPWDKEYLRAKRWDLGVIPSQRQNANWSVNCSDVEDLHPAFWETYKHGEPFGIVNLDNIRRYGRMGELRKDTAQGVNPCAEATLEDGEPCNIQDIALPNLAGEDEFLEVAVLMHRWGKRVTMEPYHHEKCDEVVKRNRRVGTGIMGCLQSPMFNPETLDRVYRAIQAENVAYSAQLDIPPSIRTTLIKPGGTLPKMFDVQGEGISGGRSRHFIQRVRFATNNPLVSKLQVAGHHIEPAINIDGSTDPRTVVVDFYVKCENGLPVVDEGFDTWKQLDAVVMAQRYWADQSISTTVYYKREEIPRVKEWLTNNLRNLKTVSFLCESERGWAQMPKEPITEEQFERLSARIKPVDLDNATDAGEIDEADCVGGACPVR